MIVQKQLTLHTAGHGDIRDITRDVQQIVRSSGIAAGMAHIFNIGSTAAVGMIEMEPGLQKDLSNMLDRLMPPVGDYHHEKAWHDGNAHSHLQATTLGGSLTVPIAEGNLVLGTWQQIFHLECDVRPRSRTVMVTVVGEPAESS